jgi:signal transduction histidine kinase
MEKIKQFFSPPHFADEALSRRASLLSFIVNLHLVIALGVTFLYLGLSLQRLLFPLMALSSCLPALGVRVLLHRGKVKPAALIFMGLIATLMPTIAFMGNFSAATVPMTAFQLVTIVMAGLLLGGPGAFSFLIFTVAMDALMLYGEANGWYLVSFSSKLQETWIVQVITYTAVTVMLWLANRLIQESFARAQREDAERRRAEQAVRQLNAELEQRITERDALIRRLEAQNAELEQFAYAVSHDLKSPIITVQGFLGYVERDARSGNLERLNTDIARITEATKRMSQLLNELLELSRIGRPMNQPENVPFESIAGEAVGLLRGSLEARGVRVQIAGGLPTINGDRARLVEAVQNLVDNACKFMGDQPEPHIEIGQRGAQADADGKPILFVRDNGIGIDPQYQERIFGLFNKLDAQSEGTGVGLALVKRIVEVHGGKIWVESQLGQGATFCFTLPTPMTHSASGG